MNKLFIIVLLGILGGCAPKYVVNTYIDKYDGYKRIGMQDNYVGGIYPRTEINLVKIIGKSKSMYYYLELDTERDDWLFIRDGESLVFLIDGKRMGLKGDGSSTHRNVLYAGRIQEVAYYDITTTQIEKLAYASEISYKLIGSQYHEEKALRKENILNIKRFYEENIKQ